MLRDYNLMAFACGPIKHPQNFMHIVVGIDAHAVVINYDKELAVMLVTAQSFSDIREMSCSSIKRSHYMKLAVMPLVSVLRIQVQIHMRIFGKAKLFDVSIPMANANKKLLDVATRRIDAQNLVPDLELQNPVM